MPTPDELVEEHLDYVPKLARAIACHLPDYFDFDDLVAFGRIGLVEAANLYDPDIGVAFTTFAYNRIRGAIFDGVRHIGWLPDAVKEQAIQKAQTLKAIRQLDLASQEYIQALERKKREMGEAPPDPRPQQRSHPLLATLEAEETIEALHDAVDQLPEPMANIIRGVYFENKTITDIAADTGKNKSSISRAHSKALDELRRIIEDL